MKIKNRIKLTYSIIILFFLILFIIIGSLFFSSEKHLIIFLISFGIVTGISIYIASKRIILEPLLKIYALFDQDQVSSKNEMNGISYLEENILQLKNSLDSVRKRLIKSEDYFKAFIEDKNEFVCRFNRNLQITFVNRTLCNFIGVTADEMLNKNLFSFTGDRYNDLSEKKLRDIIQNNEDFVLENVLENDKGEKDYIEWTIHTIKNSDGETVEYQSIGRDITERKKVEQALSRK